MRSFIVILVFLGLITSCSDTVNDNNISSTDTLIVDQHCAVFYYPDPVAAKKLRAELGKDEFLSTAEDHKFFMDKALKYAEFKQLKTIDATGNKFLRFIYEDRTDSIVNIDEMLLPWGIFFFDQRKRPKNIDITIIDLEYQSYFDP